MEGAKVRVKRLMTMIPIDEPWATRELLIAVRSRDALTPSAAALLATLQG